MFVSRWSVCARTDHLKTQMQLSIREEGKTTMDPTQHTKFINLHTSGELLKPEM